MRTCRKNKQRLMYSLYESASVPEVVRDRDGNPMLDDDGNFVYEASADAIYGDPVSFFGNIAFRSGEADGEPYGISVGDYDSILIMNIGEIPINETSLIFKESTPEYDDDGRLLRDSADFSVVKVQPSLNMVVYLLKRIVKNA